MKNIKILIFLLLSLAARARAGLNLIVTTTDLGAIVSEVAGESAKVSAICPPSRDPHFLEAKPSYMLRVSKADWLGANGLDLETGWLPSILRGARNPKVMPGNKGYFEAGSAIKALEIPSQLSRAQGDVHPYGNPHFMLDPLRAGEVAQAIAKSLGTLDAANAGAYSKRADALKARLENKAKAWKARVEKSGVTKALAYHRSLLYFFDRFGIEPVGELEPKPGIPPTASHLVELVQGAKAGQIKLLMLESWFERAGAEKLASEVPGLRIAQVSTMPEKPEVQAMDGIYEAMVKAVEAQ